jgi:hypothetical protein
VRAAASPTLPCYLPQASLLCRCRLSSQLRAAVSGRLMDGLRLLHASMHCSYARNLRCQHALCSIAWGRLQLLHQASGAEPCGCPGLKHMENWCFKLLCWHAGGSRGGGWTSRTPWLLAACRSLKGGPGWRGPPKQPWRRSFGPRETGGVSYS